MREDVARRRLLHYIGDIRTRLRMDNWDVVLHGDHLDVDDTHAETWQHENHTVLNIKLAADFFDLEPSGIRNTVIHELVHAQHRDVTRLWDRACSTDAVPKAVSESWDVDFQVHMERFVSWTTDRIEDTMPLWDPRAQTPSTLPKGCFLHSRPS